MRFGKLDAVGSTPKGHPQSSEPLPQRTKPANKGNLDVDYTIPWVSAYYLGLMLTQ
jgi:hypothetical protein